MAIREIEESELNNLVGVAQVFDAALKNPQTREQALRMVKAVKPDAVIPELDAADPIREELAEMREIIEQDRAERREREINGQFAQKWQEGQNYVRRDKKYTAEGLAQIEEFMVDNAIADHRIGVAAFEAMNPTALPMTPGGAMRFDYGNPDTTRDDKLFNDLVDGKIKQRQFLRAAAAEAIRDVS